MSYEKLLLQIEETNSYSETSRCDLCRWLVKSHSDPWAERIFFSIGILVFWNLEQSLFTR